MKQPRVFAVCGYKHTGKTTLVSSFVQRLSARGCRVGVIKHDGHDYLAHPLGTDSHKFVQVGAKETILFDDHGHVSIDRYGDETPALSTLIGAFSQVDVILVEGMKEAPLPKWVLLDERDYDSTKEVYVLPDYAQSKDFHQFVMGFVVSMPSLRVVGSTCPVYHRDDIESMIAVMMEEGLPWD